MNILHKINPFLYQLFNVTEGDREKLISVMTEYYNVNQLIPVVSEKEGIISVNIQLKNIYFETVPYTRLISLCENRQFSEAYPLAVETKRHHIQDG